MTYKIQKSNGKWLLKNKVTGKTKGTHDSYTKALKQMRLLYHLERGGKLTKTK